MLTITNVDKIRWGSIGNPMNFGLIITVEDVRTFGTSYIFDILYGNDAIKETIIILRCTGTIKLDASFMSYTPIDYSRINTIDDTLHYFADIIKSHTQ